MKKYTQLMFSYKGRVNRKTYLLYHICAGAGYFVVAYFYMEFLMLKIDSLHPELQYLLTVLQYMLGLLGMALLYGTIPISIKRYHDRNLSGWVWFLWSGIIPFCIFIGTFIIFSLMTHPSMSYFEFIWIMLIIDFLYPFCSFIVLGCLPGTKGSNKYGDPPETVSNYSVNEA